MSPPTGRIAPTPSGDLHLGNVVAFTAAWLSIRQAGGRLLLRIEDLDTARARAEVEAGQRRDLAWLGLDWDDETPRQSSRTYDAVLSALGEHTYRCTCTRKQVAESGGVYDGTCRDAGHTQGAVRFRLPPRSVSFTDRAWGAQHADPERLLGDPVLVRRDGVVGYQLAVVADDIADGITEVVRGADLLDATAIQVLLWEALGTPPPTWLHAPMILGPDGRKLSKSHASASIADLRDGGWHPADIWQVVLPWLGLDGHELAAAVEAFDPARLAAGPFTSGASRRPT